ncbi:MAG: DUF2322 family protein [Gammaproteobacteria bacterium]|nr:DUF2322 family protein [Gammaproteobacteria bacterium]
MSNKNFGEGFNDLQPTDHFKHLKLTKQNGDEIITLDNIPGKQASVKILYNIASNNVIGTAEAQSGLALYGDYTEEEKQQPYAHPNIRLLIDIIEYNEQWSVEAE